MAQQVNSGDAGVVAEAEWHSAFLEHRDDLLAFLTRRTRSTQQASDLLHDLFVRLSTAQPKGPIENPRAYFFRAARNLVIDVSRSNRYRASEIAGADHDLADVAAEQPSVFDTLVARDDLRRLDAALAELPEETRAMIFMLRIEGLSYRIVARKFGVSQSTVEKRVAKAIQHCKRRLAVSGRLQD